MKQFRFYFLDLLFLIFLSGGFCACDSNNPQDIDAGHDASAVDIALDIESDSQASDTSYDTSIIYTGPNLIPNPDAKDPGPGGTSPAYWLTDFWGTLTATFTWLESGAASGTRALRAEVMDYQEGDAKWAFERILLPTGTWFEYSDYHRSDGRSRLIWSCQASPDTPAKYFTAWQSDATSDWVREAFRFYVGDETCYATVMHLLDRDGWLETDGHQLAAIVPLSLRYPLVSIVFDDIWKTAITVGLKELNLRGMKGSFYIDKGLIDDAEGNYATTFEIQNQLIFDQRHEVGSHAFSHVFLTRLSEAEIEADLQNSVAFLEGLGVESPGFAYPFGDFNNRVEVIVKNLFPYARTSLYGFNDAGVNPLRVQIFPVTAATLTETIIARINDAVRTSTWLVLLFHGLGEPLAENPYITSKAQFIEVLTRLEWGDIKVLTVKEALHEIGAIE